MVPLHLMSCGGHNIRSVTVRQIQQRDATARAAAHANMAPHRMRQACSALNLKRGRSPRARALASCGDRGTPGTWLLSSALRLSVQPHHTRQLVVVEYHHGAMHTPSSYPSTTTSNLLPSWTLGACTSMSRTMRLVRTRPRASLQILARTLSRAYTLRLSIPAYTRRDDGHENRVNGHIGTNVHTKGVPGGGVGRESP